MTALRARSSRRLAAAAALAAVCVAAVLVHRGVAGPWTPQCPPYRHKGPPAARVVLVEFSDFQCPACAAAQDTVQRILALHGDSVRVLYKHLPWETLHAWARRAALSAECAGRQNRFWEMHDLLFKKQQEWTRAPKPPDALDGYARSLHLDAKAYAACLQDPSVGAAVDADALEARRLLIHSTPTFFVNGRRFAGSRQLGTAGLREIERLAR